MGYWKWLWEAIKPKLNKLKHPHAEAGGGIVIAGVCVGVAVGLGQTFNHLYYLLFLGIIPGILVMLHSDYRTKMRETESEKIKQGDSKADKPDG